MPVCIGERRPRARRLNLCLVMFAASAFMFGLPWNAGASSLDGSYQAAPGEANQIVIDSDPGAGTFSYTDEGVSSIDNGPFSPCTVSGNTATCENPNHSLVYEVYAEDLNDTISDQQQPGYPVGWGFDLFGGAGDDRISVVSSFDFVDGGSGNDVLTGGSGTQTLIGGGHMEDHSTVSPTSGPDDDQIQGGGEVDFLFGGPGTDHLDGGAALDEVEGGDGNDTVVGGAGNDELDFARGDGGGSDVLDGGEGDDIIVGSYDEGTPDLILCGDGTDRAQIGVNDVMDSQCERVEQLVSCPATAAAGPCQFTLQVSAARASAQKASSSARTLRGKRLILGQARVHLQPGKQKTVEIWLKSHPLGAVLKKRSKARGFIDTLKPRRKHRAAKRVARTRFALTR
jgi:RTX calcium-binding nonapeptide repeat (4 copies)